MNCKQVSLGRLVTQEEKERLLEEGKESSSSPVKHVEMSNPENCHSHDIETEEVTQPNKKEAVDKELTVISSDNESDSELLLVSEEHTHRRTLPSSRIKRVIKEKAINYYHWFLLLFKNGWWKTTLVLWCIG